MLAAVDWGHIGAGLTIVGVVIAIIVGLVQLAKWWGEHRRGKPEPSNEHLSQLTQDAAADLNRMEVALGDVWLGVHQLGRGLFKSDRGLEVADALREVGEELDDRHSRLKIAYGPDSAVAESFGEASAAAVEAHRALRRIRDLHTDTPRPGDDHAEAQVDELFENDRAAIDRQRDLFKDARARFESVAAG